MCCASLEKNILSQVQNLQKYMEYTELKTDFNAPEIINKTVCITGKKKNHILANSVVSLSVKCVSTGRIEEERTYF